MGARPALDHVRAALTAAGVDADIDPRNLNPPCAWLTATQLAPSGLCGSHTVTVEAYLIVPDTGNPTAYDGLDALLADAQTALGAPDAPVSLNESVVLSGGAPLPAYKLTLEIEVSNG